MSPRRARRKLNAESIAIAEKNSANARFQQKFTHPRSQRTEKSLPASPFAYILTQWRDKKNWYAKQAAAHLGVPLETYRSWEWGRNIPGALTRAEVARRMDAA